MKLMHKNVYTSIIFAGVYVIVKTSNNLNAH